MTLEELMIELRTRLEDWGASRTVWEGGDDSQCLWSDAELVGFLDEAQTEYFRRRPFRDSSTAEICEVAVTSGEPFYTVDSRILHIHRAKLGSQDEPLVRVAKDEMDEVEKDWETRTAKPIGYIYREQQIRLVYIPLADDTLYLDVDRLPLASLSWDTPDAVPEVPIHDHRALLDWATFLALDRPEADTSQTEKAAFYAGAFEMKVGVRKTSWNDADRRVRFGWVKRTRGYYR
jgi:hypothetical protein